jgi:hypothetical protein
MTPDPPGRDEGLVGPAAGTDERSSRTVGEPAAGTDPDWSTSSLGRSQGLGRARLLAWIPMQQNRANERSPTRPSG